MVLKIGFAVIFEGAENTRFSARITPQDADLRHEKYRKRGYKDPTGRIKADASGIYPKIQNQTTSSVSFSSDSRFCRIFDMCGFTSNACLKYSRACSGLSCLK